MSSVKKQVSLIYKVGRGIDIKKNISDLEIVLSAVYAMEIIIVSCRELVTRLFITGLFFYSKKLKGSSAVGDYS